MKRYRQLRRLEPDAALVRRRVGGETLRRLAADYGVAHTTLSRYFARPEVAVELARAARRARPRAGLAAKRRRRLRRLVPDPELVRRRVGGASLRALAADYGVAHTTLSRYFAWPEVAQQLAQAAQQLRDERRAEQRASAAGRAAGRRFATEVRRRASEQAARERAHAARAQASAAARGSRPRRARSGYAAWLDDHDAGQPLTRAQLHSRADELAADAVAAGGGIDAILAATGFRTLEHLKAIDPVILTQALDNDRHKRTAPPPARSRP